VFLQPYVFFDPISRRTTNPLCSLCSFTMFRRIFRAPKKEVVSVGDSDTDNQWDKVENVSSRQFLKRPRPDDIASNDTKSENTKPCIVNTIFETIPKNIWIEIATPLSAVDRASLGFTCRHTHKLMGRALRLSPISRHQFLQRLENDGTWLAEILCGDCKKFHLPRVEKKPKGCSAQPRRGPDRLKPHSLPSQVHFDLVTAILRCHRFNATLYTTDILASTKERTNHQARIINNISARVSEGHLILKTETILCPGNNRVDALKSVPKLERLLKKHREVARICQHNDWLRVIPFAFRPHCPYESNEMRCQIQCPDLEESDLPNKALHNCLWTHEKACWAHCDASSRVEASLAGLCSCTCCSTDYKINIIHGDGQGSQAKFLVLTSWKDLGRGTRLMNTNGENTWQCFTFLPHLPCVAYLQFKVRRSVLNIERDPGQSVGRLTNHLVKDLKNFCLSFDFEYVCSLMKRDCTQFV
jgi:hypothetical protein